MAKAAPTAGRVLAPFRVPPRVRGGLVATIQHSACQFPAVIQPPKHHHHTLLKHQHNPALILLLIQPHPAVAPRDHLRLRANHNHRHHRHHQAMVRGPRSPHPRRTEMTTTMILVVVEALCRATRSIARAAAPQTMLFNCYPATRVIRTTRLCCFASRTPLLWQLVAARSAPVRRWTAWAFCRWCRTWSFAGPVHLSIAPGHYQLIRACSEVDCLGILQMVPHVVFCWACSFINRSRSLSIDPSDLNSHIL